MLVQITSSLISLFHMMFSSAIWLMLEKNCHPDNRNLLTEIISLFQNSSNQQALFQIKIHVLASSFMALLSFMAQVSNHYHGMRVCILLKMIVSIWGLLGLVLMHVEHYDIGKLICFSEDGYKIVTGYVCLTLIHFAALMWHTNHVRTKNTPYYLRTQLLKRRAASVPNERRPMFDPVAA